MFQRSIAPNVSYQLALMSASERKAIAPSYALTRNERMIAKLSATIKAQLAKGKLGLEMHRGALHVVWFQNQMINVPNKIDSLGVVREYRYVEQVVRKEHKLSSFIYPRSGISYACTYEEGVANV